MHIIQDSLLFCFYIDKIVGTVRRKGILVPRCIPLHRNYGDRGGGVLRGKEDRDDRWKSKKTTLKNTKP